MQNWYEAFSTCRHCGHSTIFVQAERLGTDYAYVNRTGLLKMPSALNKDADMKGLISNKDMATVTPLQFLPADFEAVFLEGVTCLAVGSFNSAVTIFRLYVDLSTEGMLHPDKVTSCLSSVRLISE